MFDYKLILSIMEVILSIIGIIVCLIVYRDIIEEETDMENKKRIKRLRNIYALYIGDKNVKDGTSEELASYLNVKPETILFYTRPVHKNNRCNYEKSPIVIFVGKERI